MNVNLSCSALQKEKQEEIQTNYFSLSGIILFVYLTWPALSGFVIHFDGAGRIPNTLIVTAFFLCFKKISLLPKEIKLSIILLTCLFLFHVCNVSLQGSTFCNFNYKRLDFYTSFLSKWLFVCVYFCEIKNNIKSILFFTLLAHCFCVILYFMYGEVYVMGGQFERFYSDVINANNLAFICLSGICILFLMFYYNYISLFLCGGMFVGFVLALFQTGCRTGFVCLFPLTAYFLFYIFLKKMSAVKHGLTIFLAVVMLFFLFQNLTDTSIIQRMEYRETESENWDSGFLGKTMGGRTSYFYTGYEIFKQFPVFGVGYGNYIEYSTGTQRNHVEYMAELSEGGLFGFTLYMLFLFSLLKPLTVEERKKDPFLFLLKVAIYLVLLLFSLGLFTSLDPFFYVIAGLLFSSSKDKEKDISDKMILNNKLVPN